MGGETPKWKKKGRNDSGLSPRGRGNPAWGRGRCRCWRSIPAWAGKPWRRHGSPRCCWVYPRVGGETNRIVRKKFEGDGLSPRGRGNRDPGVGDEARARSIPAWAGKPPARASMGGWDRVYPRVGGETTANRNRAQIVAGLSPRGRGNPVAPVWPTLSLRSIPAWAGKPSQQPSQQPSGGVYPRVGGETSLLVSSRPATKGLSPRGRGNRGGHRGAAGGGRSIPAWAGKPDRRLVGGIGRRVYPRVGGETCAWPRGGTPGGGLSPRGRGNQVVARLARYPLGSIPAWAGKPPAAGSLQRTFQVYPRVGGETPCATRRRADPGGLSPRGRGNRRCAPRSPASPGSIPAWAGKPRNAGYRSCGPQVYPRVGGETRSRQQSGSAPHGLSPRGRGNQQEGMAVRMNGGSIPAWAGKPRRTVAIRSRGRVYPRVGGETTLAIAGEVEEAGLSPRGRGNPRPARGRPSA